MIKRALLLLSALILVNQAFSSEYEYIFVCETARLYWVDKDGNTTATSYWPFRGKGKIKECMYSFQDGTFYINILTNEREVIRKSAEFNNNKFYESLTGRELDTGFNKRYAGLFYDYQEKAISSSYITYKIENGKKNKVKHELKTLKKKDSPEKTNLNTCLSIRINSSRTNIPNGNFSKAMIEKRNDLKDSKLKDRILGWGFAGQSKKWLCYNNGSSGTAKIGDVLESRAWVYNKSNKFEAIHEFIGEQGEPFVYPDVILFRSEIEVAVSPFPAKPTGDFYIQLPDEEELRKIQMDPKAKHLWANAESVFFQLGKDILRVDYADGQQEPVKICEIEDELFCMFEKDNILAALAEDDKPNKKEKDKNKEEK